MGSSLDLVGFLAFLGGDVARSGLAYASVHRIRVLGFFVLPGLYIACAQVLKCLQNFVASTLFPGKRDDALQLLGLQSSLKLHYAGLQSGTQKKVANALFEGWVRQEASKATELSSSRRIRNRPSVVGFVRGELRQQFDGVDPELALPERPYRTFVLAILQAGALLLLYFIYTSGDITATVVTTANMVALFLLCNAISAQPCRVKNPKPAAGCPPGNSIVADEDNNNLWVVVGDEKSIQSLLQYPVQMPTNTFDGGLQVFAACLGCGSATAAAMLTPTMSSQAQLYFAGELLIGFVAGLVLSSGTGDKLLSNLTTQCYSMQNPCRFEFSSRAAAVAAAFLAARGKSSNLSSNFLPETGEPWIKFRRALDRLAAAMESGSAVKRVQDVLDVEALDLNPTYGSLDELVEAFDTVQLWESRLPAQSPASK